MAVSTQDQKEQTNDLRDFAEMTFGSACDRMCRSRTWWSRWEVLTGAAIGIEKSNLSQVQMARDCRTTKMAR